MFWCSVALVGLLLLPILFTRLHRCYYKNCSDSLVLEYRYFTLFNLIVIAIYAVIRLFWQMSLVTSFIYPASSIVGYLLVLVVLAFVVFSAYAILQDRLFCITPALMGIVLAVMTVLFFMFQLCHYSAWRVGISLVDIVYALTVAVAYFRYTCRVVNHYLLSHPVALAHL